MLILLIIIVHYCKKIKTKCLKTIQEFWKVSLTFFLATCICTVYGLKEKYHLEEIISLRLKEYCCSDAMKMQLWSDKAVFSSCVVWNVWIMLSGIFLLKCSVCVSAKKACLLLQVKASLSPFYCVLLTLLWNLTSLEKSIFVKICTIML